MKMHVPQLRQNAFTLMETAIVLVVVGIIFTGIWVFAGRAWNTTKLQDAAATIATTVANVRSYYGGQAGVPNLGYQTLTSQLIGANVIPSSVVRSVACSGGSCADNPTTNVGTIDPNGSFRVCNWILGTSTSCTVAAPGAVSSFFGVNLTALTRSSCISLVQALSGSSGPSGLTEVNINGTNLFANGKPIQPVTATDATTNCTSVADGSVNVTFVYRVGAASF